MSDRSAPKQGARGILEDVKGKIKGAWASLTDDKKLKSESDAQQRKADAQREAAKEELDAEKARADAAAQEAVQRSHQDK